MVVTGINYIPVLFASIASMIIGFAWYSPSLFGKRWMKLMGYTPKSLEKDKQGMGKVFLLSFLSTIVMALVLANIIRYIGFVRWQAGAYVGFWMWLGFIAPVQMTQVLFGKQSWELFGINTGHQLASILVMGAILASR